MADQAIAALRLELQAARDHEAWVVTNDQWRNHRARSLANDGVRRRTIRFSWLCDAFAPGADDMARFSSAR